MSRERKWYFRLGYGENCFSTSMSPLQRPCLYVSVSTFLSLHLCLYPSVSAPCHYVSVSTPLSLRLCLYTSVSTSLSLHLLLYISVSTPLSLRLRLYISVSTPPSLHRYLYVSVSTSLPLQVCIYVSIAGAIEGVMKGRGHRGAIEFAFENRKVRHLKIAKNDQK